MKLYKSIAYAYPTSPRAKELHCYETGCFYVEQRYEGNPGFVATGTDGDVFQDRNDPDLLSLFAECEGELDPLGSL